MVLFTPEYLCKHGKKAACLREGDYEAGHAITHVQTHVQSRAINCSPRVVCTCAILCIESIYEYQGL